MPENQYLSEPLDLALLCLRLLRQAKKLLFITVLGTVLLGGGYCLKKLVLEPARFVATSLYEVEYAIDPATDNEYTFINGETWNQWMDTKEFLDLLYHNLEGTPEADIDRETMKEYLSARLQMSLRMPDTMVTTPDPALSLKIAAALEQSMVDFAAGQKGIDNIRVVDPAVEAPRFTDARPWNACILSAIVTFFLTLLVMVIRELGQDGIWLPDTLYNRYGLNALGTEQSKGLGENLSYVLRDCKAVGVLPVGAGSVSEDVAEALRKAVGKQDISFTFFKDVEQEAKQAERIRALDGVVLAVQAGPHMGRRLEDVLSYLRVQECQVTAAVLVHADERLIRRYHWRAA